MDEAQEPMRTINMKKVETGAGVLVSVLAAALMVLNVVDTEIGVMIGMIGIFLIAAANRRSADS